MTTDASSRSEIRRTRRRIPRLLKTVRGVLGLVMFLFVLGVALLGPLLAPYSLDEPIGTPGLVPSQDALLGTDFLGRDVLSRVLYGGFSVLLFSFVAVLLTYAVGVTFGMLAGFSRSWLDSAIMRTVDLFIAMPAILVLLVLVAGAGSSGWVIVFGTALVSFPGVARLVRAATLEVAVTGYVEAAVARGESAFAVIRREILPNIIPPIIADAGVRSVWAVYLFASLAFLGFGPPPPAANWGLMIAENRLIMASNSYAVLAPAVLIALLAVSLNVLGEAYVASRRRTND